MDELLSDPKETCAEKENRAKGKAVETFHESHEEKQIKRITLAITVDTANKSGGIC